MIVNMAMWADISSHMHVPPHRQCCNCYAGMKIATYANARTALEARKGVAAAFMTGGPLTTQSGTAVCYISAPCCPQAEKLSLEQLRSCMLTAVCLTPSAAFRSGAVMGFLLASFGLAALFATLLVFRHFYDGDWTGLYEAITGFGLGGSAIALFGRVGGGIYTKAADVGADLVGKVCMSEQHACIWVCNQIAP